MADELTLEFTDPAGEPLRVEWSAEALAELVAPAAGADPAWRISGELDWDEVAGLRIVSGRLGADQLLAVAALRPRTAEGHGDELVAGALGDAAGFGQLDEVLLSTEYGPERTVRRIGLELYRDETGLPIRVAGDAITADEEVQGRIRRAWATFELRSGGDEGIGVLDVLTLNE
jgi:hypothetical protein